MKKVTSMLLLALAICGCAQRGPTSSLPLEQNQSVYIAIPKDVPAFDDSPPSPTGTIRDNERFPGTGSYLASMMKEAFRSYASQIIVADAYEPLRTAVASAKDRQARYVFVPEFDIHMRRRIMWQPRKYTFSVVVVFVDTMRESEKHRIIINIAHESEPSYHTEEEMEKLKGPIDELARTVFTGAQSSN